MGRAGRPPRVVVGVDGSAGSRAALEFAAGEARLRQGQLVAVTSVRPPDLPGPGTHRPGPAIGAGATEAAERLLRAALQAAGIAGGDLDVDLVVTAAPAAEALVERSRDADLLVIGSPGRRARCGLPAASVRAHCVLLGHCPVVVVPPATEDGEPATAAGEATDEADVVARLI